MGYSQVLSFVFFDIIKFILAKKTTIQTLAIFVSEHERNNKGAY